jgi:acyl transferase domain-containing protein
MKEFGEEYEALLKPRVQGRQPTIPFFSSVTRKVITEKGQLGPAYWRSNLESPVLFHAAIELCLVSQIQEQVFLEVGPHSALAGPIRQILKAMGRTNATYVNALTRSEDSTKSVLKMAGELHLQNVNLDFAKITRKAKLLTDLPLYQWHHSQVYWNESRVSKEWRLRKFPLHELLGARTLEGSDIQPEWRNVLRLDDVPWIRDHKVIEDVVFPCAGYVAMAGEAIRQIAGAEDFTMRHVTIQAALVLQEFKAVELLTSLRPVKLTTTLDSAWYDFSIASYNGSMWMKHCCGQVRAGKGKESAISAPEIAKHPRRVADPYGALRGVGLNYGPAFQGLTETSALPGNSTATAKLLPPEEAESFYYLHPTTIDHCLQLIAVAASEGLSRHVNKLCVPTSLDQLYICGGKSASNMSAQAVAIPGFLGLAGDIWVVSGEDVILSLKGVKCSPLDDDVTSDSRDTVRGARLEWKPDIEFAPIENLIRPWPCHQESYHLLEEYTLLSIIEIRYQMSALALPLKAKHMQKFSSWLDLQCDRAAAGEYELVPDSKHSIVLSSEERLSRLVVLRESLATDKETAALSAVVSRVLDNCHDLFEGKIDGIGLLLPEEGLTKVYDAMQVRSDCEDFFALLGNSKPTLRVLEIGAGTGGTTAAVLRALTSAYGERLYSSYT